MKIQKRIKKYCPTCEDNTEWEFYRRHTLKRDLFTYQCLGCKDRRYEVVRGED